MASPPPFPDIPLCRRVCAAHVLLHALQTADASSASTNGRAAPDRLICRASLVWREAFFALAVSPQGLDVAADARLHVHIHADEHTAENAASAVVCAACGVASAPSTHQPPLPPMQELFFVHSRRCDRRAHDWSASSCDCLCSCVRCMGDAASRCLLLLRVLTAVTRAAAYDSRARCVLRIFTSLLCLPPAALGQVETNLAAGLLAALRREATPAAPAPRLHVALRVGMIAAAAVTGAVVLTVTGGLATPAILAAAGAIASSIGVSAGILASSYTSAAIIALFGLYGGGFLGYRMHARTSGLSVFEFKHLTCAGTGQDHVDTLHAVVAVSGALLPPAAGDELPPPPKPAAAAQVTDIPRAASWRRVWPFSTASAAPPAAPPPTDGVAPHADHVRPWGGASQCTAATSTDVQSGEPSPVAPAVVNMPTLCVCDAGLLVHPARTPAAAAARDAVHALLEDAGVLFPEDVMMPATGTADAATRFTRAWPLDTFSAAAHVDDGCISLLYRTNATAPGAAHADDVTWAICGFIGHTPILREQADVHACEVRIVLASSAVGNGWGTAALRVYTGWLLTHTPATRVYFTLPARAARAYACAERVGYTVCGTVMFSGERFIRMACEATPALAAAPVHVLDDAEYARACSALPMILPASAAATTASPDVAREDAVMSRLKGVLATLPDVSTSVNVISRTGRTFLTVGTGACASAPGWMRSDMPSATGVTLVWDPHVTDALGASLTRFIRDYVSSSTISSMIAHTSLAALASAVALPSMAMSAFSLMDTPWGIAHQRADEAGVELAHALMSAGVAGHRPVTLLGYGVGARVCWRACLTIAQRAAAAPAGRDSMQGDMDRNARNPWGIINDVVLMGAPIAADARAWAAVRGIVSGRLVNVYSRSDVVCGYVYRVAHMAWNVAGAGPVTQSGLQTTTHVPGATMVAPALSRVVPGSSRAAAVATAEASADTVTPIHGYTPLVDEPAAIDGTAGPATRITGGAARDAAAIEANMENVDVSHIVTGHLEYRNHIQEILAFCGLLEVPDDPPEGGQPQSHEPAGDVAAPVTT